MEETTDVPELQSPTGPETNPEVGATVADVRAADEPDPLAELTAEVRTLSGRLGALTQQLHRQQDVVHSLHEENQRLRLGEVQEAVAPLIRHLIELIDQSARIRAGADDGPIRDLLAIEKGILEGLRRNGVERREIEPGSCFDPSMQRAVSVVDTPDASLNERVAEVVKAAYIRISDGRSLREAEVAVYRYVPETPAPAPEPEGTNE